MVDSSGASCGRLPPRPRGRSRRRPLDLRPGPGPRPWTRSCPGCSSFRPTDAGGKRTHAEDSFSRCFVKLVDDTALSSALCWRLDRNRTCGASAAADPGSRSAFFAAMLWCKGREDRGRASGLPSVCPSARARWRAAPAISEAPFDDWRSVGGRGRCSEPLSPFGRARARRIGRDPEPGYRGRAFLRTRGGPGRRAGPRFWLERPVRPERVTARLSMRRRSRTIVDGAGPRHVDGTVFERQRCRAT